MSLIVMKFGGTSVGSAERIRQAANIVHQHAKRGDEVVVVVSALSKVTDLILNTLNSARLGKNRETEEGLQQLRLRHKQVLDELCHGETRERVGIEVEATLTRVQEFCSALLLLGSATPQVMDMVLPLGEQISARMFAACLSDLGAKGAFVDSAQLIVTDDKFGDATPDMDTTHAKCAEALRPLLQSKQ